MEESVSDIKLQRRLRPIHVWSLALGSIIGWGAFVMPGNTFLPNAGPLGATLALGIGAAIMVSIAFNYSYMINRYPVAGGEYVYAKSFFGKGMGFVCAWFLSLSYLAIVPLNATALALIGRNLLPQLFKWGYIYSIDGYEIYIGEVLPALIALALFAFICIRGIGTTGKFQTILALALVVTVLFLGITALFSLKASNDSLFPLFQVNESGAVHWSGILAVIAVAPWAFVGFDSVPQASEEFNFSTRKSKVIMIVSILVGGGLYGMLNLISAAVIPSGYSSWKDYIADIDNLEGIKALPTFNAAKELLGSVGLIVLAVALFCAVLSGIVGFYVATSRLLYSLAQDRVLPSAFGKLHSKTKTPYVAILFVFGVAMVAPWFGRNVLSWVVDMSAIGAAIGYAFTSAATLVSVVKNKDGGLALKVNSVVGVLLSVGFAVLLLTPSAWNLGGLGFEARISLLVWMALGFLFFIFCRKKFKKRLE